MQRLWLSSMTKAAIREAFGRPAPREDLARLEEAARSRSEADWIVGMNATRAATIRLRSSFDGAVSLGRVQTPTLAILARREEEIRAFKPEKYWLVDATFEADRRRAGGATRAASTPAPSRGSRRPRRPRRSSTPCGPDGRDHQAREVTKKERAPLLYDLTSLQREANTRFGFSARRTLAAAQRLYEEHKALTYPRTNSRFLTGDMVGGDQADRRAGRQAPGVRAGRGVRHRSRHAAARARGQRRQGHRPPRDHPHEAPSTTSTR